ncbi:MAG TPA: hypothetical protein PKE27_08590 [Povalibacter sp.]|uniref:hypothetical protein n=1 Tax=Povalibacter sp. TaxID=1962978 RepID=UPI002C841C1B|nr:hypothetical protein [Povalibacter sp.]HMN44615.1 hypothetical protein [Povalibacter sp.]
MLVPLPPPCVTLNQATEFTAVQFSAGTVVTVSWRDESEAAGVLPTLKSSELADGWIAAT